MARYLLLYTGPATKQDEMSPDEVDEELELWREWFESIGDAVVEVGAMTRDSDIHVDDGSAADPLEIAGYSIIETSDMASAKTMCASHPFVRDASGDFAISIHELHESPDL